MAKKKPADKVTIYLWRDDDDKEVFSVFQPIFKDGNLKTKEDGTESSYYLDEDDFREGLGVRTGPVPAGRIVRVTLAVEAVEAAEVSPVFKPLAPKKS